MREKLTIPQALFLLARDDETGKPLGNYNSYIQPAGALAELIMMERLAIRSGRKAILEVLDDSATGSAYLDTVLGRVAASSHPHTIQRWVGKLYGMRGRVRMIAEELVAKGVVEDVSRKWLGIFPLSRWKMRSTGPKRQLKSDMSRILFRDSSEPDEWIGTVIAIANAGHLLKRNFDREDLRMHKAHIKGVVAGDWPAAGAAKQAIQAAIAAATSAAVIGGMAG